jgi:hypothetical protein
MPSSYRYRRRLRFEELERRAMPAAQPLVGLPNMAGLAADSGSRQGAMAEIRALPPASSAVSGGSRAAAAQSVTTGLNSAVSPATNSNGLSAAPISAASSWAIEVQSLNDSPASFINSTFPNANNLDSIITILDPSLGMQAAETNTVMAGIGENNILSTDLLLSTFNEPTDSF